MPTCIMSSLPSSAAAPATKGFDAVLPPLTAKTRPQTCCALPQGVGVYASARLSSESSAFTLNVQDGAASWGEVMRAQLTDGAWAQRAVNTCTQATANSSAKRSWLLSAATTCAQPAAGELAQSATAGAQADEASDAQCVALNNASVVAVAGTRSCAPVPETAGTQACEGVAARDSVESGQSCAACFHNVLWEQNLAAHQSTGTLPLASDAAPAEALALPPTLLEAIAQEMGAKKLAFNAEAAHGTFGARLIGATLPDDLLAGSAAAVDGPTLALWARDLAGAGAPYLPADASAALVVNETRRDLRRASAQDTLAATRAGWTPLDDTALAAPLDPVEPVPLIELGQAGMRWDDSPLAEPLPRSWRLMSLLQSAPDLEPDLECKLQAALEAQAAYAELFHDWRSYDGLGESGFSDCGLGPWAWDADLMPDPPFLSQADLDWIAAGWNDSSAPLSAATIPVQLPLKEQVRRRQEREQEEARRQRKGRRASEVRSVTPPCSSSGDWSEAHSVLASGLRCPGAANLLSAAAGCNGSSLSGGCYD